MMMEMTEQRPLVVMRTIRPFDRVSIEFVIIHSLDIHLTSFDFEVFTRMRAFCLYLVLVLYYTCLQ